jgi:hypothetical protein
MFFIALIFFVMSSGRTEWGGAWLLGAAGGLAVYNRSNILPMGVLGFAHDWLTRRPAAASCGRRFWFRR